VLTVFGGGDADDAAVVAEVDLAARAVGAGPAGSGRVERDAVAGAPTLDARTDGDDFTGGLVAHYERRATAAGGAVQPWMSLPQMPQAWIRRRTSSSAGTRRGEVGELEVRRSGEDERFRGWNGVRSLSGASGTAASFP